MLLLYVNNSPRSNQDKGWTCLCDLGYLQQAHSPNYTDSNKQCVGCKREDLRREGIGLSPRTSPRAPDVIKIIFCCHPARRVNVVILMCPFFNCWSNNGLLLWVTALVHLQPQMMWNLIWKQTFAPDIFVFSKKQLLIVVELWNYYTYYKPVVKTSRFGNNMLADIILKCDRKAMRLWRIGECHDLIVGGLMCRWAEPWLTSSKFESLTLVYLVNLLSAGRAGG